MKDEIKKAKSILDIIKTETNNGRFSDVSSLYLTILDDIDASSLTQELNEFVQKLKVLSSPDSYPDNDLANLILLKKGKTWDWNLIEKEKAWPLIPILEKAGMLEGTTINWIDYFKNLKEDDLKEEIYSKWENSYNFKRFILTKSIEEASKKGNKALTLLFTARLIGDNPLVDFDLNNLNTIRSSLNKIGLTNLSDKITQEIITSKIVNL